MTVANAGAIAASYVAAWTTRDFVKTRSLLRDDVTFVGPLGTTEGVDASISGLQGLAKIVTGAEQKQVIVDGDDVCIIYDLMTIPSGPIPTAAWYHLRDGKIDSIRAFFDARPFMKSDD
jgi:ketosteroid isomerase-like protein